VRTPVDPVHWFLDARDDVRSSYYLEDVATEFHVQGLELDWVCVVWDTDFRFSSEGWEYWCISWQSLGAHPVPGTAALPKERLSSFVDARPARHGCSGAAGR